MHDAVYAAQQGENQGAFARDRLVEIGGVRRPRRGAFGACLDDRAPLVDVLDDTAAGVRGAIESTPDRSTSTARGSSGVPDRDAPAAIDAAAAGASPAPLPTAAPLRRPVGGTATDGRDGRRSPTRR